MKRLSIIMSAVLMAIFFTACSDVITIKMTENHAIVFIEDQTTAKSSDFISVDDDGGTYITVKSEEGEQKFYVKENYNFNEFSGSKIKLKENILELTPLTGFLKDEKGMRPVQALAIDTSCRSLVLTSIPNSECLVYSSGHLILTDTNGKEIPFMYVSYKENNISKDIYVPVLRPEKRFESDTDNVIEQRLSGRIKCARVM